MVNMYFGVSPENYLQERIRVVALVAKLAKVNGIKVFIQKPIDETNYYWLVISFPTGQVGFVFSIDEYQYFQDYPQYGPSENVFDLVSFDDNAQRLVNYLNDKPPAYKGPIAFDPPDTLPEV